MSAFEICFVFVVICFILLAIFMGRRMSEIEEELKFMKDIRNRQARTFHEILGSHATFLDRILDQINEIEKRVNTCETANDELGKLDIPTKLATLEDAITNDPNNDNYDDIVARLEKIEAVINGDEDVEFDASEEDIVI